MDHNSRVRKSQHGCQSIGAQSPRMSVDLNANTIVPLSAAARRLPPIRGDKPPHYLTVLRWATKGIKMPRGEPIVLESFFLGGTRVTTFAALERFFERLSDRREAASPGSVAPPIKVGTHMSDDHFQE